MTDYTQLIPNIGIAGFSMWILYKMFLNYQERSKEKDQEFISLNKEIRDTLTKQLAANTTALNDNTAALTLVANRLK